MYKDSFIGMSVNSGSYYQTCSASFDNIDYSFAGDIDTDGDIDEYDLGAVADEWLNSCSGSGWCGGADINQDGVVDMKDFSITANNWLMER